MPSILTLQAAKWWCALLGAVVSSALAVLDGPPDWLVVVSSVLTALVVYAVPNQSPPETPGKHAR
jgi:hypothetical protein